MAEPPTAPVRTLILGFGPSAEAAARLLLREGQPAHSIKVLDARPERMAIASAMELTGERLTGETRAGLLARIDPGISKVMLDLDDDEASIRAVRSIRPSLSAAAIRVVVRRPASAAACMAAGASDAICAAGLAGLLLAESVEPISQDVRELN